MSDPPGSRFRNLHSGFFVLPNPWDVGSAVMLERMGFRALATTSSGYAMSLGRSDGEVGLDELVNHTAELAQAVGLPINVDAERLFADDLDGVSANVERLAGAGAAGVSIEDWNPDTGRIDDVNLAASRVAAAVEGARGEVVITARAENLIRGIDDLDDTLARLATYRDAGADALYAPGVKTPEQVSRVVDLGLPVNVLAMPGTPRPEELAQLGVARMSTGGAIARLAYRAAEDAAQALHDGERGATDEGHWNNGGES